jgi:hypothetical protein
MNDASLLVRLPGVPTTATARPSTLSTIAVLPVCSRVKAAVVPRQSLPLSHLRPRSLRR